MAAQKTITMTLKTFKKILQTQNVLCVCIYPFGEQILKFTFHFRKSYISMYRDQYNTHVYNLEI